MNALMKAAAVDQELFKVGMQQLASTVTVITSAYEGARSGMTATAVCSLSPDPASLIISVNRSNRTFGFIMDSRKFAVNLLSVEQENIANAFASSKHLEDQFRSGAWSVSECGAPVLTDALAVFVCDVDQWMNTKTHTVFCGNISECNVSPDRSPLLFGKKQYQALTPVMPVNM